MTNIIKLNGEIEEFSEDKILKSAQRVGVPRHLQQQLLDHIKSQLYENMPTSEIFKIIKKFLRKTHKSSSIRYNLKKALAELGPSGYPFEKYIAELIREEGFSTQTNVILKGKCVSHEVDVLATKQDTTYAIEAKFHSKKNLRSDVKVVLYIKSRYEDILQTWTQKTKLLPWVVTNTRFTTDAHQYAKCSNLRLMSWDFPQNDGLRDKIEKTKLHPITMLESISQSTKLKLIELDIVTCKQVLRKKEYISKILQTAEFSRMINEIDLIYRNVQ